MKRTLLVALIAVVIPAMAASGCSKPAPTTPAVTAPPTVSASDPAASPVSNPPAAESSPPAGPAVLFRMHTMLRAAGEDYGADLTLTAETLHVEVPGLAKTDLPNPFGGLATLKFETLRTYAYGATDNLLVTIAKVTEGRGWVLRPEGGQFKVVMEAQPDWNVEPFGSLVRITSRRAPNAAAPEFRSFDLATGTFRSVQMPPGLTDKRYYLLGTAPWPGGTAWVVGKEGAGADGVFVEVRGKVYPLRSPEPVPGSMAGPSPLLWIMSADLDGDGTTEYVLNGTAGLRMEGLWVYHYDDARNAFQPAGEQIGVRFRLEKESGGNYAITEISGYSDAPRVLHRYSYSRDHFVPKP